MSEQNMDWTNGPPKQPNSKPFDEQSANKLRQLKDEVDSLSQSDFFKIASGESIEVFFDMDNEGTKVETKTFKQKDGTEVAQTRLTFQLFNMKTKNGQSWRPANTWARKAIQAMEDFNTNNLVVRRNGSSVSDTSYDFLPVGLKRAG